MKNTNVIKQSIRQIVHQINKKRGERELSCGNNPLAYFTGLEFRGIVECN